MRASGAFLLFVLLVAGTARAAAAAEESRASLNLPGGRILRVDALWGPRSDGTGWGFVRVELAGDDTRPMTVHLSVAGGDDVSRTWRSVTVEPGGKATAWLPRVDDSFDRLEVSAGEDGPRTLLHASTGRSGIGVVVIHGRRSAGAGKGRLGLDASGTALDVTELWAEDLPPTWTLLSGAALAVVHGSAEGLGDPARQRVLTEYVEAGGSILVLEREDLPAGPLAHMLAADRAERGEDVRKGRHGLGRWLSFPDADLEDREWSLARDWWLPSRSQAPAIAVVGQGLLTPEHIPGLGRAPVRLFFFLLLGFALVSGPGAYLVLRRRRRVTAMVVVVPVLGILFAGVILGVGLLSEGFGTRGVVRTFALLDQRTHTAVCAAERTLYSAWSPASLPLSPDTVVSLRGEQPAEPWRSGRYVRPSHAFVLDAAAPSLEGTALPSRTRTTLATLTRARARDRLRFARRSDGLYDVLSAEAFEPVPGPKALLLRDFEGRYHGWDGPGRPLRPRSAHEAKSEVFQATLRLAAVPPPQDAEVMTETFLGFAEWNPESVDPNAETRLLGWLELRLGEIPKGSYLAWTTRAPAFDALGLDVAWKAEQHLVLGLLAREDVE